MILAELTPEDFSARAAGPGVAIRTGPFASRIGTDVPELARAVHFLYGDFPLVESGPIDFGVRVECTGGYRRWVRPMVHFTVDGQRPFHPFPRRLSLPLMEWGLNWCIYGQPHALLACHAGVVARQGRALLLPGSSGSGKSTLSAGLVARGWRLLSDELALIDLATGELRALARPISLKNESIAVIRRFWPEAAIGPEFADTAKGRLAHVRPPAASIREIDAPARPAWIVFPRFRAGQRAVLAPVSRARALLGLGEEAINYGLFGAAGFTALADLTDRCACRTLVYSSLEEAVALIDELAR